MSLATIFPILLMSATLLCALVAGLLFAFAIVTMPGIGRLNDGEFIRAFQVMDEIIQNNHPLFMLVWLGSALTLLLTAVIGFGQVELVDRVVLLTATALYIFGVQLPTITINVPLNSHLQTLDVSKMGVEALAAGRQNFETRWNLWNNIRTAVSIVVTILLIILLLWL